MEETGRPLGLMLEAKGQCAGPFSWEVFLHRFRVVSALGLLALDELHELAVAVDQQPGDAVFAVVDAGLREQGAQLVRRHGMVGQAHVDQLVQCHGSSQKRIRSRPTGWPNGRCGHSVDIGINGHGLTSVKCAAGQHPLTPQPAARSVTTATSGSEK